MNALIALVAALCIIPLMAVLEIIHAIMMNCCPEYHDWYRSMERSMR